MEVTELVTTPDQLLEIFNSLLGWLFTFAMVFSIGMALYAAYLYLFSAGDPTKVQGAHRALTFAAVGIAVALIAGGLPQLISVLITG